MYWRGKSGARFIRPIRSLLALLNGEVVPFAIEGVRSGSSTFGHRRLGAGKIEVSGWEDYKQKLEENFVILSAGERRKRIERGYEEFYPPTTSNVRVRYNPALLEDLVYLTEYPTVIRGDFDPRFLSLPDEVLETVMLHHQKYFAVEDENGKLAAHFVAVANLDGDPAGVIRQGHERVLRARFNDAEFFWQADQKRKLSERVEDLKLVTFHAKLGSYYDKTRRNQSLVAALAEVTGGLSQQQYDDARRAAELAKCDLTTEMVGEFPELQGIIGGLYAGVQGESKEVADAIYDHYKTGGCSREPAAWPYRANRGNCRQAAHPGRDVSTRNDSDRIERPFRPAPCCLRHRSDCCARRVCHSPSVLCAVWLAPARTRLSSASSSWNGCAISLGKKRDLNTTRSMRCWRPRTMIRGTLPRAVRRSRKCGRRKTLNHWRSVLKRIKNILQQAGGIEQFDGKLVDESLLESGPEAELFRMFEELRPRVAEHKGRGDYVSALSAIASLRPPVDLFFDEVLVMAKEERVRRNRLIFLAQLLGEFSTIADFAEIVSAK